MMLMKERLLACRGTVCSLSVLLLVCARGTVTMGADVDSAMLKAGVAKVDITPPVGITMSGYGDWPSEGIHDSLRGAERGVVNDVRRCRSRLQERGPFSSFASCYSAK